MRRSDTQFERIAYPAGFGLLVLLLWEGVVRMFHISPALLPPPSAIGAAIMGSLPILWEDWVQTVVKGALNGLWMGSAAGIAVALVIDRYDFLKRGLLPVANFMAALPIVGLAPIMVMWFGFDWHSKAAVVAIMVFFPMLVNTLGGLASTDTMQRDLMRTYAAGHVATLVKLRVPAALPFVFNGLKIATTLASSGQLLPNISALLFAVWDFGSQPRWGAWQRTWFGPRLRYRRLQAPHYTGLWRLSKRG